MCRRNSAVVSTRVAAVIAARVVRSIRLCSLLVPATTASAVAAA
jgi:hypothetical protein